MRRDSLLGIFPEYPFPLGGPTSGLGSWPGLKANQPSPVLKLCGFAVCYLASGGLPVVADVAMAT